LASKTYLLGLIEMEAIIQTEREASAKYQKYLLELGYKISPEGVPEMVPNGQAEVVYTELTILKKNYEILKESHRKVVEAGKQGMELVNFLEKRINSLGYDAVNNDAAGNPVRLVAPRVPSVRRKEIVNGSLKVHRYS
jgi:hypothetical protein